MSEQYVKCGLSTCSVRILIGYTDPSRPFYVNDETAVCMKRTIATMSGSRNDGFRYFCSQTHREEGKGEDDMTVPELLKLARKNEELHRNSEEIFADRKLFEKREQVVNQEIVELSEDLKCARDDHQFKLRELKADVYRSKRSLKEIGETMKRESANLERLFRQKELEFLRKKETLELSMWRELEGICIRQISILQERDIFSREMHAGTALQEYLLGIRKDREEHENSLLELRESIRISEEQHISLCQELDELNKELSCYCASAANVDVTDVILKQGGDDRTDVDVDVSPHNVPRKHLLQQIQLLPLPL